MASGFITMLDVSIVNVALPSIEKALHAGPADLQVILAGYTLAFGLVLIPSGRIGDVLGRRAVFVIGIAAFGVTSLLAGLAPWSWTLAVLRLLQGAAAGLTGPQVTGLIQQMFAGKERAKAFGLFGATIGVSTALGPLAGGLLIAAAGPDLGWRLVFFVNVPIVAVIVPLSLRLLPGPPPTAHARPRLDAAGLALIALGTALFMAPFVMSGETTTAAASPQRWWLAVGALVLLPLALWWEVRYQRRYGAAAIDPALVRNPDFRYGAAVSTLYFTGFTAIFLLVTLVLQNGLGYTPLQAGLVALPFAVASGTSAALSGRLVARFGRLAVVGGLALAIVGLAAVDLVLRYAPGPTLAWALPAVLFVTGAGSGCVISPNQALTLARVPVTIGGVAGAVMQVGQRIGQAVGLAMVLAWYFATLPRLGPRLAAADALLASIALLMFSLVVACLDAYRRRGREGDALTAR
jgi:MFS family permease